MQCWMVSMICYATHAFYNHGAARTSWRALVFSHPSWGGPKEKIPSAPAASANDQESAYSQQQRQALDEIHHLVPHVMRHPVAG